MLSDGSGELDYDEFVSGFGIDDTKLVRRLFAVFDTSRDGQVSVLEVTMRAAGLLLCAHSCLA